jgi:MSHA biogenesis protein MshO
MRAALNARLRGFTFIEMIVVIVILGIVGTTFGIFIVPAVNANRDLARRAALLDSGEIALRRMERDIRIALPNSLRISNVAGTGFAIEMIPTVDGGRYCVSGDANCAGSCPPGGADGLLCIGAADTDFDILGCFHNATFTGASFPSTAFRLVVGDSTGSVYTASGTNAVVTPSSTSITLSTVNGGGSGSGSCGASSGVGPPPTSFRHHIVLSAAQTFPSPSSSRRVFIIQTPVTYICSISAGTLTRYYSYAISATAPTPSSPPAGATTALVTDKVSDCTVTTDTATVQANGYVKLSITLANSEQTAQLSSEMQLDNSQ